VGEERFEPIEELPEANRKGGFAPPESYAIHRERLGRRADDVDPNVRLRVERGREMSASDYVELTRVRARLVAALDARLADFDALVMPTTAIVAPPIDEAAT